VLGLAIAAAGAGTQNSRVLYVFLLILTIGIGAIVAKRLMAVMARGRKLIAAQDQRLLQIWGFRDFLRRKY